LNAVHCHAQQLSVRPITSGATIRWQRYRKRNSQSRCSSPPFASRSCVAQRRSVAAANWNRVDLQHITIGLTHEWEKFGIAQPRRKHGYDKPNRLNRRSQHAQPHAVIAEILLRAIEIELELFNFHGVRASFAEKLFGNVDDHARRCVIFAEWSGERRNAKRNRTRSTLPFDRFPIDRCLDDVGPFTRKSDLGAQQHNTVHSFQRFA
jgi:hypothetical protein